MAEITPIVGRVLLTGEEEDALQEIMMKCFVSIRNRRFTS